MYEETQRRPPSHIMSVHLFNLVVDIKSEMILQLKTQGLCAWAAVVVAVMMRALEPPLTLLRAKNRSLYASRRQK